MNYKKKSRRRFFLLMRSRTPPISSEFRGGGFEHPKPPLGTPLSDWFYYKEICYDARSRERKIPATCLLSILLLFCGPLIKPQHCSYYIIINIMGQYGAGSCQSVARHTKLLTVTHVSTRRSPPTHGNFKLLRALQNAQDVICSPWCTAAYR